MLVGIDDYVHCLVHTNSHFVCLSLLIYTVVQHVVENTAIKINMIYVRVLLMLYLDFDKSGAYRKWFLKI